MWGGGGGGGLPVEGREGSGYFGDHGIKIFEHLITDFLAREGEGVVGLCHRAVKKENGDGDKGDVSVDVDLCTMYSRSHVTGAREAGCLLIMFACRSVKDTANCLGVGSGDADRVVECLLFQRWAYNGAHNFLAYSLDCGFLDGL